MKALCLLPLSVLFSTGVLAFKPTGTETVRPPFRFLQTAQERLLSWRPAAQPLRLLPPPKHKDPVLSGCVPMGRYDVEVDNYALCITGILRQAPRKVAGAF